MGRDPLPAADVDDVRPRLNRLVDGAGEIQLREVPLLIGEDRDNQPATPRRQPGDRAVVAPADHAGHVGTVPAHPPAGRRPLAKVASGVRSAPAKQGWSRSTGPSSTATQTPGSPLPPPRVPPEIRDARDGRDVCHRCPSVSSTTGPIWLDGSA